MSTAVIERLLCSHEPSVRWRLRSLVLGEARHTPAMQALQEEIRQSARVTTLLSERGADGTLPCRPYTKWYGAHWVLVDLADLGYPPGDAALKPLRDQVLQWVLGNRPNQIAGRYRRCASQEGNAVYAQLTLGLADERTEELVRRLASWQWPDGGWNCDRRPAASHSSFMESLIPLRALALYARVTGSPDSARVAAQAADIFLKRHLFRRKRDGTVIDPRFTLLHYPCYWHYDILFALKVMVEAGFIGDERCREALELLEAKRLPDGGFPAEARYYRELPATGRRTSGLALVDWGPTSKRHMNEWVTADALYVLHAAGHLPKEV